MEREAYLIEQIESYIDQLDLLGMQTTIDQERIDGVVTSVEELATEYENLLSEKMESKIQAIEETFVETLLEELEKRLGIHSVVVEKLQIFENLFSKVKDIKVATKLQEHINSIIENSKKQVHDYESDVKLVEEQLEAIKNVEKLEASLREQREKAHVNVTNLRNSQISYTVLDENISKSYIDILDQGNANQINFESLKEKESALKKRQGRLLENLELARTAVNAEGYVVAYEERVRENKLQLDEIAEKKFLHLLKKIGKNPVDSYQALEKRTKTIQALIHSRIAQVKQLYQESVTTEEKYQTIATQIDHTEIYMQLHSLSEIEKNEQLIKSIDEKLEHTRDDIKGKSELEAIFIERAKERGRTPVIPKAPIEQPILSSNDEEPEILFEEEEDFEKNPSGINNEKDKKRRQVLSVEPAKTSLLEKLGKVKSFLLSSLEKLKSVPRKVKEKIENSITSSKEYSPAIGDKITLGKTVQVYSDPMSVIEKQDGKDAISANLHGVELFITKGAILDYTGTPIYITADYGQDLEMVAKNLDLASGTYNIALGCSIGDEDGSFIAASMDKLNPEIEKGWISAKDADLIILNKVSKEKGGMVK